MEEKPTIKFQIIIIYPFIVSFVLKILFGDRGMQIDETNY